MSDCLYVAWEDYMKWLGKSPSRFDYYLYRTSKSVAHGSIKPQYTFGGVVPWMLAVLGMRYGFHVRGEYRLYTPLMYTKIAPCKIAVRIINRYGLGSYAHRITLSPAMGSAAALGPLALLPALGGPVRWPRRVAAWAAVLVALLLCGSPVLAFVAFAAVVTLIQGTRIRVVPEIAALAVASVIALAALSPRLVLDRHSAEPDAPAAAHPAVGPRVGLAALVVPTAPPPAAPATSEQPMRNLALAYLGLPVLLLAGVGVAFAPPSPRALLAAVALVSLLGCLLPGSTLARAGPSDAPRR